MSLHEGTITAISISPSVEYKALNWNTVVCIWL